MPNVFHCSACNCQQKRPVGSKCQFKNNELLEESISSTRSTQNSESLNQEILMSLNAVSSRLSSMASRMDRTEEPLQGRLEREPTTSSGRAAFDRVSYQEESDTEDDAIILSAQVLKGSRHMQEAVDQRLKELTTLNEKGTFKSQRGGNEQIFVKRQVPWPQKCVLSGTDKNKVSYDSFTAFQWVCGLCNIISEEKNVKTKHCMLDYMTEIMEDAQDFGWASAKGAHALLLCRMEECKVNWHMTEKIDRIRRAHAQKVVTNASSQGKKTQSNAQSTPCKFFQMGKCSHTSDHVTNGHSYKHICNYCFGVGKRFPHHQKDCRNAKKVKIKKTSEALL